MSANGKYIRNKTIIGGFNRELHGERKHCEENCTPVKQFNVCQIQCVSRFLFALGPRGNYALSPLILKEACGQQWDLIRMECWWCWKYRVSHVVVYLPEGLIFIIPAYIKVYVPLQGTGLPSVWDGLVGHSSQAGASGNWHLEVPNIDLLQIVRLHSIASIL